MQIHFILLSPTMFLSSEVQTLNLKLRRPPRSPSWTFHGPKHHVLPSPFAPEDPRGFEAPEEVTTAITPVPRRGVVGVPPSPTVTRRTPKEDEGLRGSKSSLPCAARLPFFIRRWQEVTTNSWILNVVQNGYKLQFNPDPPPPRSFVHSSYSPNSSTIIRTLLLEYIDKGAIKVVDICPDQFVSRIFEVPKKTGDYRLILDLSDLNCYLKKVHFKMDGLPSIASLICLYDYMASLDLQDAFLTVAMHPSCFKYLCFDFEGVRYCFIALVFGLSCAPRIFTKLLKVPLSSLRLRGIKNSAWLDDILFVGSSLSSTSDALSFSISFLESLGFIIKPSKSHLTPSQTIRHVGFHWDSVNFSVSVPCDKVSALKDLCSLALSGPVSFRFLARIIGTIDSFKFGCPIAPLHYRFLQFDLITGMSPDSDWSSLVSLSPSARSDLMWWLGCDLVLRPSPLTPFSPSHHMETDASLVGWGAFSHSKCFTQGRWSFSESNLHINCLELKAIFFGVRALFPGSSPISLLIHCDNVSAVRYVNHMGGTRSRNLCCLALELWDYCLSHNIWLRATYYCGTENVRADRLSRVFSDNHDYHLSSSWFTALHSHLDFCLDIDLFASRLHHHLPRFSSRLPDPEAEFVDAFSFAWSSNVYLFPPVVLLCRVVSKFISDNCPLGLLIAPFRPTCPSFNSILDLCVSPPISLPDSAVIREPRHCRVSHLLAWTISNDRSLRVAYLGKLSPVCSRTWTDLQSRSTSHIGPGSSVGVTEGRLILATSL